MGDIHPVLADMCDAYGLDYPEPGERWEFETPGDSYDDVKRLLERSGCHLHQNYVRGDMRRWEYTPREPGWPEPLGYSTREPPEWVGPQTYWQGDSFKGTVGGSIPDAGDCGRHPDLPPDAYALNGVNIYPPDRATFGARNNSTRIERPERSWQVTITYKQARGHRFVEYYSTQLGEFPDVRKWKAPKARPRNTRRRIEFFDAVADAIEFAEEQTRLDIR